GKLLRMRAEKFERALQMTGFAGPRSQNLQLLARDHVRIERHRTAVAIVTQHEILAAVAAHLHPFWHGAGSPDTLDHHICPVASREFANGRDSLGGLAQLLDIERVIGAEL